MDVSGVDGLTHERTEKQVIGEADVLHLFGESAHALELAIGRREGVLVFGHGLRGGNDLLLDNAIKRVEDGRDSRRLLRGGCSALGADGWGRGGHAYQDERYGKGLIGFSLFLFLL